MIKIDTCNSTRKKQQVAYSSYELQSSGFSQERENMAEDYDPIREYKERTKGCILREREEYSKPIYDYIPEKELYVEYCGIRIFSNSINHTETESLEPYFQLLVTQVFQVSWTRLSNQQKITQMELFINNELKYPETISKTAIDKNNKLLLRQTKGLIKNGQILKKDVAYLKETGELDDVYFLEKTKKGLWKIIDNYFD